MTFHVSRKNDLIESSRVSRFTFNGYICKLYSTT
jgi:hypothetical protein